MNISFSFSKNHHRNSNISMIFYPLEIKILYIISTQLTQGIKIYVSWLVRFHGISTLDVYLKPNPVYIYYMYDL